MSGSNSSGIGAPRGRTLAGRLGRPHGGRPGRRRPRCSAASPSAHDSVGLGLQRRDPAAAARRAAASRRPCARRRRRAARRRWPRRRPAATACRAPAGRRRARGARRARRRAAGSRGDRRAAPTRVVVTSTSASAPARSRPTSTPQQRRRASPALAVAISPSSRASRAPPSASSFHSAATFSSPSRFLVPDGAQSEPRHTRCPWRRAARTSVVSPYSQMLENGDHTIVPAPRSAQSAYSVGAERGRVDPDQVGVHAAGPCAGRRTRRAAPAPCPRRGGR